MNEVLEAFVIIQKSAKYYRWLKTHPKEVDRYKQGRNFEYAVMNRLRKFGWYCVRKFGSKGYEDIVATRNGTALFVQCKHSKVQNTSPENFDLSGLVALAKRHGAFAIFAGISNRHMYFQVFDNGGWKEWKPN